MARTPFPWAHTAGFTSSNGASLKAVCPAAIAACALAAKPSGVRTSVRRLMLAYTGTRSRFLPSACANDCPLASA